MNHFLYFFLRITLDFLIKLACYFYNTGFCEYSHRGSTERGEHQKIILCEAQREQSSPFPLN